MVMGVNGDSTRVQLTVTASNDGDPTTARDWNLILRTSKGELHSYHAFGDQLAKQSLDLPRLDSRLQQPIDEGTEVPGLISFVFSHVPQETIAALAKDPQATAVLSAVDRNGKRIVTERNIHEMAAERFQKLPSK